MAVKLLRRILWRMPSLLAPDRGFTILAILPAYSLLMSGRKMPYSDCARLSGPTAAEFAASRRPHRWPRPANQRRDRPSRNRTARERLDDRSSHLFARDAGTEFPDALRRQPHTLALGPNSAFLC